MRNTAIFLLLFALAQPQQLYDDAIAAYRKNDFAGYLANMEPLAKVRGYQPAMIFNYAGALALNGRGDEAIVQLKRLVDRQIALDLSDTDLDSLRKRDDFRAIEREMAALSTRQVSSSKVAFRIDEKGIIPEAIAYDSKTKAFFVSSVRKRKIVRIDSRGVARDFVTKQIQAPGGMAVDAKRRILWASSAAYPRIEGYAEKDKNDNALFAFDADSGALLARYDLPKSEPHIADGVSVDAGGTVYLSDGFGALYRLPHGAKALELFVKPGTIRSPQASAVAPDGTLYVADYTGVIWTVDRQTGDAAPLAVPDDLATNGIDGLGYHDHTLFVIQNGVTPHRVARLTLDPAGRRITAWRILDMNTPDMDEPTNGVIARDAFYWIADSQGHAFDGKTQPNEQELRDVVVMRAR